MMLGPLLPWRGPVIFPIWGPVLPFDITICGEPEIACTIAGHTHAVSIMDPGLRAEFPRGVREENILRLSFHDLEVAPPPDDPVRRALERLGRPIVVPEERHVRAILEFGRRLEPGTRVLVHCMAGISRSTAAAWMLGAQAAPGREAAVLRHVRRIRPQAMPNRLMVRLADDLLGAGGRMVALRG